MLWQQQQQKERKCCKQETSQVMEFLSFFLSFYWMMQLQRWIDEMMQMGDGMDQHNNTV